MALGAYSVIRYSNNLNDQRVNLGVLLWHPVDGMRRRITPFLDRAQAVDPRIRITPLKQQLELVTKEFDGAADRGQEVLRSLAHWFREGLEITEPYPAEMFDVEETLEQLYQALVSPVEEFRRASTQRQFERSFKTALASAVKALHGVRHHDHGTKRLNGIEVNVGVRTTAPSGRALWRALSLQSEDRPDDLMAKAKSTAMDIHVVRCELAEFKQDRQVVAVQAPKPKGLPHMTDCLAWLKHEADEVLVVPSGADMAAVVQGAAVKLHPRQRQH